MPPDAVILLFATMVGFGGGLFTLWAAQNYRACRGAKVRYKLADLVAQCNPKAPVPKDRAI